MDLVQKQAQEFLGILLAVLLHKWGKKKDQRQYLRAPRRPTTYCAANLQRMQLVVDVLRTKRRPETADRCGIATPEQTPSSVLAASANGHGASLRV